jgi:hypothetical protein
MTRPASRQSKILLIAVAVLLTELVFATPGQAMRVLSGGGCGSRADYYSYSLQTCLDWSAHDGGEMVPAAVVHLDVLHSPCVIHVRVKGTDALGLPLDVFRRYVCPVGAATETLRPGALHLYVGGSFRTYGSITRLREGRQLRASSPLLSLA